MSENTGTNELDEVTSPDEPVVVDADFPVDIDDEAVADSEPGDPVPIADVGEDIEMEKQGEVDPDVGVFVLDGLAAAKAFSEKRGKTARKRERETLFLSDGLRRIDYIVSYTETTNQDKLKIRETFEANLKMAGLELEVEDKSDSVDEKTFFLKVHATWDALATGAELLNIRKRIKMPKAMQESSEGCCSCSVSCGAGEEIVPEEDDYFTAPFHASNIQMFEVDPTDPDDLNNFFTNSERGLIVKEILERTVFTPKDAETMRLGITKLVSEGVYNAVFPLHEGPFKPLPDDPDPWEGRDKDRSRLYEAWARPGRWYTFQPLDLIRKYFGEKIAIYFAWLGYYTGALIPAALCGIAVFIYGLATMFDDIPSNEICDESIMGRTLVCPQCDLDCDYTELKESCIYSRLTYVFDNYGTVAFAAFMAIWSTCFLEFWKRKENMLQYEWDVANYELEERMRPEFEFKVKKTKQNPVTAEPEPYLPFYSSCPRYFTSFVVITFMICLVVAAIFGVIVYRIVVVALLYSIPELDSYSHIVTTLTAAAINLVIILILNLLYSLLAKVLTDMELHRTETEYEDSLIFKIFLFKFVNFYGSTFYIAFFKGSFTGHPGSQKEYLFGRFRQDECDPAGCIVDLFLHLGLVMVGKQAINNVKELLLPWFKTWWRKRSSKKAETTVNLYMRWEQDNDLEAINKLGLFEEYLEMVIQFGFVTIFVAAFPLAPLFALLNNIIEIRLDAYKFVTIWRRPAATKAQDIGIWLDILTGLSFIAVLSNAFIIGWTSDFVPKMMYRFEFNVNGTLDGYVSNSLSYFNTSDFPTENDARNSSVGVCRYRGYRFSYDDPEKYQFTRQYWEVFTARLAFVIVFEHICFLVTWFLTYIIPDEPAAVTQLKLQEKQLIKKLTFDEKFAQLKHRHTNQENAYQNNNTAY